MDSMMGGRSINPETGLPEYFSFGGILKGLVRAAGAIAGGAVGGPGGAALGGGLATKLTGGSMQESLTAGLMSGVGSWLAPKGLAALGMDDSFGGGSWDGSGLGPGEGGQLDMAGIAPEKASWMNSIGDRVAGAFTKPSGLAQLGIGALTLGNGAVGALSGETGETSSSSSSSGSSGYDGEWREARPYDRKPKTYVGDVARYAETGGEHEYFDEVNPKLEYYADGGPVRMAGGGLMGYMADFAPGAQTGENLPNRAYGYDDPGRGPFYVGSRVFDPKIDPPYLYWVPSIKDYITPSVYSGGDPNDHTNQPGSGGEGKDQGGDKGTPAGMLGFAGAISGGPLAAIAAIAKAIAFDGLSSPSALAKSQSMSLSNAINSAADASNTDPGVDTGLGMMGPSTGQDHGEPGSGLGLMGPSTGQDHGEPGGGDGGEGPGFGGPGSGLGLGNGVGGIGGYASGGPTGFVRGHGTGQDDKIPALLSDGEYVVDSDVVSALGDGSNDAGAKKLDQFRQAVRTHKRKASPKGIPPKAKGIGQYMKGAA